MGNVFFGFFNFPALLNSSVLWMVFFAIMAACPMSLRYRRHVCQLTPDGKHLIRNIGRLFCPTRGSGVLPVSVRPPHFLLWPRRPQRHRSEEHTSELQSLRHLVCRL